MLLAIDTAAHLCSAAVYDARNRQVVGEVSEDIGRGHAERLMDVISSALSRANCNYSNLTGVAATTGPGSFTGIRVGLATARGIALALSVPATGVGTLDALCAHALAIRPEAAAKPVLVLIDARRGEVYGQFFGGASNLPAGPFVDKSEAIAPMLRDSGPGELALCGSGAVSVCDLTGRDFPVLHELATAPIAIIANTAAKNPELKPEPLYLRPPDAKPQTGFALQRA